MSRTVEIRKLLGLSQKQLAEILGTNRTSLALAESGTRNLSSAIKIPSTILNTNRGRSEPELYPEELKLVEIHQRECEKKNNVRLERLKKQIKYMDIQLNCKKEKIDQCVHLLHYLKTLLDSLPVSDSSRFMSIQLLRRKTLVKYLEAGFELREGLERRRGMVDGTQMNRIITDYHGYEHSRSVVICNNPIHLCSIQSSALGRLARRGSCGLNGCEIYQGQLVPNIDIN